MEKDEAIKEFILIEGIGEVYAESLYEMGYHSIDQLKKAKVEDIANIRGLSKSDAENIVNIVADWGLYHPQSLFKNWWRLCKYCLVITVIIGFLLDFYINYSNCWNIPEMFIDPLNHNLCLIRLILILFSVGFFIALMKMERTWFKTKEKESDKLPSKNKKFYINVKKEWKEVYDIYKFSDNLYHRRFNLSLLAQSMLIVSFATTLLVNTDQISSISILNVVRASITILALIFTFSMFYINRRFDWRLVFLNHKYLKQNRNYNNYLKNIDHIDRFSNVKTMFFLTNLLPTVTFFFWYFLFYISRWQLL